MKCEFVFRLESSRDDVRLRGDVLQREVADLQLRNEELTCLAQEAQSLKDEMDVLRSVTLTSKYCLLCSAEGRNSCRFETTGRQII